MLTQICVIYRSLFVCSQQSVEMRSYRGHEAAIQQHNRMAKCQSLYLTDTAARNKSLVLVCPKNTDACDTRKASSDYCTIRPSIYIHTYHIQIVSSEQTLIFDKAPLEITRAMPPWDLLYLSITHSTNVAWFQCWTRPIDKLLTTSARFFPRGNYVLDYLNNLSDVDKYVFGQSVNCRSRHQLRVIPSRIWYAVTTADYLLHNRTA